VNAKSTDVRDLRAETRALIGDDQISPAAIAREIERPLPQLIAFLDGRRASAALNARLAQFLDDRALIWNVITNQASAAVRDEFAAKVVQNIKVLVDRLAAPASGDKAGLREQVFMYADDLGRVIKFISAEESYTSKRLATALRTLLGPGDRLMISRGGAAEPRATNK
jgi:hypothetical protein